MRQVLSLSLPQQATKEIKILSRQRGFESVSGYIKHLVAMDKELISEKELLKTIREARKEYKNGQAVKADSLASFL